MVQTINKDKYCNQRVYEDWFEWTTENVPGKNFADRHEILCENYIKTKGRSYAEMFIDEQLLHKKIDDYLKEKTGD